MIRRLTALGLAAMAMPALAQDTPAETPPTEGESPDAQETPESTPLPPTDPEASPLEPHRTAFDVLAERTIGSASKPVEFNWRQSKFMLAGTGSFLFELNNFNSVRGGLMVRGPASGLIIESAVTYVGVWDTPASRQLALTPYRQPGRPNRLELDLTVGLPLAEGVVTTAPRFFPAVQLVFNAYATFRYSVYPTGWGGMRPGQVGAAIFSPILTEIEIANLDDEERRAAMQTDLGRYGLMVGFGNDVYFKQGFFISPRIMLAVPLLAPATQTDLDFWADFTLAVGVAL